jgi:hypothetical protein
MVRFLKRYGVILAAAALLGAVGVGRWASRSSDLKPAPAVEHRLATASPDPVPPTPAPPKPRKDETPKPRKSSPLTSVSAPTLALSPTPRLGEILKGYEGPVFRGEFLASVSRQIHEEGDALRAEGLLDPMNLLLAQLEANRSLEESLRTVVRDHEEAGRVALLRHVDYQMNRTAVKMELSGSRQDSLTDRYRQLAEFRRELEGSIVKP